MTGLGNNVRLLEKNPSISSELVGWLDAMFPVSLPALEDSDRKIFYRVGQRAVVDHIISLYNEQNETMLPATKD